MKKYTILILSGCCALAAGITGLVLLLNQPPVGESIVPEFVMPSQTVSTDSICSGNLRQFCSCDNCPADRGTA